MTEVARFFDGVSYGEGDQAEVQSRMAPDGVLTGYGGELAVTTGGAGFVSVASGEAFVQGFWYRNDAARLVAVTGNTGASPRIDLLVLRLDRTGNSLQLYVREGTVGGGIPTPVQIIGGIWEMPIASLSTASSATTITDLRAWQPTTKNPMTTPNDIIIGGVHGTPTRKAKGANGSYLGVDGSGNLNYSVPIGFANPMTTDGDLIVGGASGVATRVAKGAANSIFGVNASGVLGYYTDLDSIIADNSINGGKLEANSIPAAKITASSAYSILGTNSGGAEVHSTDPNQFMNTNTLHGNRLISGTVGSTQIQDRGITGNVDIATNTITWDEIYNVSNIYGAATARPNTGAGASSNPAIGGSAFYQFPDPWWQIVLPVTADVFVVCSTSFIETGSVNTIVQLYVAVSGLTGWTMCAHMGTNAAGGRHSMSGAIAFLGMAAGTWNIYMAADGNNPSATITHLAGGRTLTVLARYR